MTTKIVRPLSVVVLAGLALAGCVSNNTKLYEAAGLEGLNVYQTEDEKKFWAMTPEQQAEVLQKQDLLIGSKNLMEYRQNKLLLGAPVTTGAPDSKSVTQLNPMTDMINQSQERETGPMGMEITAQNQLRAERKQVVDKATGQVSEQIAVDYQTNAITKVASPTVVPTNTVSQKPIGRVLLENASAGVLQGAGAQLIANHGQCTDCGTSISLSNANGSPVAIADQQQGSSNTVGAAITATTCPPGGCLSDF